MRILSKTVTIVKGEIPAEEHKVMYLSGADHFVRPRHVPLVLFFKERGDGAPVMPTELLVKSLKQLLLHYPPLSGRLKAKPHSTKYELNCNDAGAEFTEAFVDGALDDFGDFQPNRLYTELLDPAPKVVENIVDLPVLLSQVTRFACGSAALVASSIHTVTDGLSVNQFVYAWSELARGLELSITPYHDRTLLKSTQPTDPSFWPKELRPASNIAALTPKLDISDWPRECMFSFGPAQLKKVKALASEGGVTFSTFQSINAHLWKSVTRARCLHPTASTKFLTTLDARKRVKPNLPEGYFGNAICFVSAQSTAGDIVKQPLSYVAGLIQEAVAGFTEEHMRKVTAFVEHHYGLLAMNVNAGDDAGQDVSIASWVKMQFLEADFGSGKPVAAAPGNNPYDGSVIMLPSRKGDGHINVYISLHSQEMRRLEKDPDFLLQG